MFCLHSYRAKNKSKVENSGRISLILDVTSNTQSVHLFVCFLESNILLQNTFFCLCLNMSNALLCIDILCRTPIPFLVFKGLQSGWKKSAGVREDTLSSETHCHSVFHHKSWMGACTGSSAFSLWHFSVPVCCSTLMWQPSSLTYKYPFSNLTTWTTLIL